VTVVYLVIARSVSDVAISAVGGNAEIATSFCGRTRNDKKRAGNVNELLEGRFFAALRMT
jgi:hypothetical protein